MGEILENRKCQTCNKNFVVEKPSRLERFCGMSCASTYRNKNRPQHRMSKSPEYYTWSGMIGRCYCVTGKDYKRYGARGVTVCSRWLESFETFYKDMGPKPSSRHSLDRINNNGNYEPTNCRWATPKEQSRNRRTNRKIKIGFKEWPTLVSFVQEMKMSRKEHSRAEKRLSYGWSDEEALGEWNLYGRVI